MNVLIVYAHPEPRSFNAALKDLAVDFFEKAGDSVQVSDLYAMGFRPVGGPGDFVAREHSKPFDYLKEQTRASINGDFASDVAVEMERARWADLIIFQFPMWWFSMPAILKGWVDRVFALGFAYDRSRSYENGLFRGKRAMLSFTTGGHEAAFQAGGAHGDIHALLLPIQRGVLYFTGMEVLPPFIVYGAARMSPEERKSALCAYRKRLASLDRAQPLFSAKASEPPGSRTA